MDARVLLPFFQSQSCCETKKKKEISSHKFINDAEVRIPQGSMSTLVRDVCHLFSSSTEGLRRRGEKFQSGLCAVLGKAGDAVCGESVVFTILT